jgi:uncharacterized lipoprotein NlpE involved in copper resistance
MICVVTLVSAEEQMSLIVAGPSVCTADKLTLIETVGCVIILLEL